MLFRSLHRQLGVTTVYVTHDQVEAMTLGTRVAVMRDGVLQQCASPDELYHSPVNVFCAAFVGSPQVNLADAVVQRGTVHVGGVPLQLPDRLSAVADGAMVAGIRPTDVRLGGGDGACVSAVVDLVENLGPQRHVWCSIDSPPCCAPCLADSGVSAPHATTGTGTSRWVAVVEGTNDLRAGDRVELSIDTRRLLLFHPSTGARIDG